MHRFKENNCRLCSRVFCCKRCRKKHEISFHNIFPECHICIYGQAILKSPSNLLLDHIETNHWPLHCVNCKETFENVREITSQNNCPYLEIIVDVTNSKTPIRPTILIKDENTTDYDSPPIHFQQITPIWDDACGQFCNNTQLTTSTPMHTKCDEQLEELLLDSSITTNIPITGKSFTKVIPDLISDETSQISQKRRVTFNETPVYETRIQSASENQVKKSSLKKNKSNSDRQNCCYKNMGEQQLVPSRALSPNQAMDLSREKSMEEQSTGIVQQSDREQLVEIVESEFICTKNIFEIPQLQEERSSLQTAEQSVENSSRSYKRARSEDSAGLLDNMERLKKMKYTDIRCRKPINSTTPVRWYMMRRKMKITTCDKATQTDE